MCRLKKFINELKLTYSGISSLMKSLRNLALLRIKWTIVYISRNLALLRNSSMSMLIILILYVDDILLASNNKKLLHERDFSHQI
jgi:hypothetical protein